MRYISLDIETTGLDPIEDQILEIGEVAHTALEDAEVIIKLIRHKMIGTT